MGSNHHRVGAGIGLALIPEDGTNAEEVLRKADIALYRAKAEDQPAARFFEEEMDRHSRERELLERELVIAIEAVNGIAAVATVYLVIARRLIAVRTADHKIVAF